MYIYVTPPHAVDHYESIPSAIQGRVSNKAWYYDSQSPTLSSCLALGPIPAFSRYSIRRKRTFDVEKNGKWNFWLKMSFNKGASLDELRIWVWAGYKLLQSFGDIQLGTLPAAYALLD